MVGEMIGSKGSKGAIVYGVYSLFDKILNGIIIFIVMVIFYFYFLIKKNSEMFRVKDTAFIRFAAAGLPGMCGLLAWAMAMCLKVKDY